jgi:hypothetical protein
LLPAADGQGRGAAGPGPPCAGTAVRPAVTRAGIPRDARARTRVTKSRCGCGRATGAARFSRSADAAMEGTRTAATYAVPRGRARTRTLARARHTEQPLGTSRSSRCHARIASSPRNGHGCRPGRCA